MLTRHLRYHVKRKYSLPLPTPYLRRPFHATRSPRSIFGLSLPVPSPDPLAGTTGDGIPYLFILQVIIGLPTALWFYKCLMLVAFQRKIIYLPSVPPGTRDESLADGERTKERDSSLHNLEWKEVDIRSPIPTRILRRKVDLKGISLEWKKAPPEKASRTSLTHSEAVHEPKVVVIYLQGNAGTPLLRIPLFRQLLRPDVVRSPSPRQSALLPTLDNLTIISVAPRSFWRSTRTTPTESTVLADYESVLEFAYSQHGASAKYVLYGHSLGGAASVLLLDRISKSQTPTISGIILENPLPSIPYMVKALYPQKWLPYHYLGFAAFDRWDAIGRLQALESDGSPKTTIPSLWIRSGKDEIIPTGDGDGVRSMYEAWKSTSEKSLLEKKENPEVRAKWVEIGGALHDLAYLEGKWRGEIRQFLREIIRAP